MARVINKLTDVQCKAAATAGRLSDGGGLYLHVKPSGAKSWAFIWKLGGKRYETGLGSYPSVKLARARIIAADYRQMIADGLNPIDEKKKETEPTFGECCDLFLSAKLDEFRNDKHKAQWRSTLETYAASIRPKRVSLIDTDDVLKVLEPIWQEKSETASRLRGRIERVLDFAKAKGWRQGENPALWRGHLKSILPARQKLSKGHHAAMPYKQVPHFMKLLAGKDAMAARGLEFLILTAARSGEVLNSTWDEIDFNGAIWTVPAHRMKAGKEHRVPLSCTAIEILNSLHETRTSNYIFAGQKAERPLSNMAFAMLMRRMNYQDLTVHGFRSAFRDWVGDETSFQREVAEQALAHRVGDATERAYRRADALQKRRELMEAWAGYCSGQSKANAINLGL